MVKFIIGLGTINKELLLPFIHIILYSLLYIYYNYNVYNIVTLYLEGLGHSIGEILAFFIFNIIRYIKYRGLYRDKSNVIVKRYCGNYLKDFFFSFAD